MNRYYIDKRGYKIDVQTGKPVHVLAAEGKIGRKLRKGEVVHHINRDKLDNRRDNLWVCRDQWEHWRFHLKDWRRYGRW